MRLEELRDQIRSADRAAMERSEKHWMSVGKPLFSLGKLETEITRIAGMKRTSQYELRKKALIVMCADNGIVDEGVTQTGREVTAIVADNFTKNMTSTCHMAMVAGVDIFPVDIGMERDVPSVTKPEYKAAYGTRNFAVEPAMKEEEVWRAIEIGIDLVRQKKEEGYDIILTGEMGIGNTTTSSAVASVLLHETPEVMTGRGAGLDQEGLRKKVNVIRNAIRNYHLDAYADTEGNDSVIGVMSKVGGLDIAGLCGVFLGGAVYGVPVVIDGFISSVAALCAAKLVPTAKDYMVASHASGEPAAGKVLDALGLSPMITAGMSLGEGSGAVALMPLLEMGLRVYRDMSNFEEINVEQYEVFDQEK